MKSELIIDKHGTKFWYKKGKLHREDGPAIEWKDGTVHWYKNGELHREGGHAIEWTDGEKHWYINGERHREDGPAIECTNGTKIWCVNGNEITYEVMKDIKDGILRPHDQWTECDLIKFKLKYL